jgi:hypothetical protein
MREATAEEVDLFHGVTKETSPVTVIETLEANPGKWFLVKANELVDEGREPRAALRLVLVLKKKTWELETLERNTDDHDRRTLMVRRKPERVARLLK